MKWKKLEHNQVLEGKGFYLSYNRNTAIGTGGFTELANIIAPLAGKEAVFDDGEETALCVENEGKKEWLILKGDFREEYNAAFPSLNACRAVYEKHKNTNRSHWSTD